MKIKYVNFVPLGAAAWTPLPGRIYIDRRKVKSYADYQLEGLINHEILHVQQQKRDGYLRWILRYIFNPMARANYEAEAYVQNIRSRAAFGPASWDIIRDYYARHIHQMYYPWWWRIGRPAVRTIAALITAYAEPYLYTHDKPVTIALSNDELPRR